MTIKRVIDAVYPVPHRFIERIFTGKDIFVKYLPRLSTRLKVGDKLMFYASGEIHAVVGEATIDGVEFLKPEDALAKYQNRLFLTKDELMSYVTRQKGRTKDKPLLVITLRNAKRYPEPVELKELVTMAGRYLTRVA